MEENNGSDHPSDDNNDGPPPDAHLGKHRQYWRDIILGVNDGLVSTFLLVTGVAGGGLSSIDILLTAISGALAGAVSMFAGGTFVTPLVPCDCLLYSPWLLRVSFV
jgi:hypothetical protein